MATILTISSQVISGHVGNSAITFTLQRLGHDVLPIPTVLLSNHPGHQTFAGKATDPQLLHDMFRALCNNHTLNNIDAILTGYLPTPEHTNFAHKAVTAIKKENPNSLYLCDPVMGDTPKGLYINEQAAETIKQNLLPIADITTPNLFELNWLTDCNSNNLQDTIKQAQSLNPKTVLITSAPGRDNNTISNLLVTEENISSCEVEKHNHPPNGTGDFMAALFLGHLLNDNNKQTALAKATAGVDAALQKSIKKPELQLIATQAEWSSDKMWPVKDI